MTFFLATSDVQSQLVRSLTLSAMNDAPANDRINITWAACPRWATSASADLVDTVERLGGLWAIVFIDIQGTGIGGRRLAGNLMHMTRQGLATGMSPRTVIQAVHEHLFAFRQGKVGASIHVATINAQGDEVQISGLGPLSSARLVDGRWQTTPLDSPPAGYAGDVETADVALGLAPGQRVVIANDGIAHGTVELKNLISHLDPDCNDPLVAQRVLDVAVGRDEGRPRSDMAVAAVSRSNCRDQARMIHAHVSYPAKRHRSDA